MVMYVIIKSNSLFFAATITKSKAFWQIKHNLGARGLKLVSTSSDGRPQSATLCQNLARLLRRLVTMCMPLKGIAYRLPEDEGMTTSKKS